MSAITPGRAILVGFCMIIVALVWLKIGRAGGGLGPTITRDDNPRLFKFGVGVFIFGGSFLIIWGLVLFVLS